tara:strand:+ start:187 stop:1407 length:1221 start_codon:yes stop_codon:yes gene_type:complete
MIKVGLDIGNSKISIIVCDVKNDQSIKILSFKSSPTNNVRKSIIVNPISIKEEVKNILKEAEKESQTKIQSINLNIPAMDSISVYDNSVIDLAGDKIIDLHINKAINQSNIFESIDDYLTIQKSIINFCVDNKQVPQNPIGTFGDKLEVGFYKFAVKKNFINNLLTILENLNINIENYIPTPLSSALSTLNSDDKLLGSICIDLGAASSSIAIFENEQLIFLDAINVGGDNITRDIAKGISTNLESAERLKTLYGSVVSSPRDEYEHTEIPDLSNDPSKLKQINIGTVNTIIKPRVEETLELIWQKLKQNNLHKKKYNNLILTGGGALLDGINDFASIIFDSHVRIGYSKILKGLDNNFIKPQFSQTIGTIYYDKLKYDINFPGNKEKNNKNNVFSRFSSWLDQYI